ncbi:MAG: acetyl-CoA carboxylase, carboxyltransferase subunit beta [Peptococcaceae bacterium]|nr:acetyl-CoA carboxylase, carboxyltransferase subunit beta [Peptococcaceae bacterium]
MRFKKPKNPLEGQGKSTTHSARHTRGSASVRSEEMISASTISCDRCKKILSSDELDSTKYICPYCRHHFQINARQRIYMITDSTTFIETDGDLIPHNILNFPGYEEKLEAARLRSAEPDSVVCGTCEIGGIKAALFVMEPFFMMGSMGSVTGEKITRTFERALVANMPVVGFTVSGGARMQEGMVSLMQMAKTSGAVKRHSDDGHLFICVLTNPTTGGVTASFAMEADIIIAEPHALIGFAGPRVIEQTIRKKLPAGFQRAEFQLEHGFVDNIVDRAQHKKYIAQLLQMHRREKA